MLSGNNIRTGYIIRSAGVDKSDRMAMGIIRKNTPKDRINGPESFPYFDVCILLDGRGSYEDCASGTIYPLKAGNYFLRIPGVEHTIRIDTQSNYLECFLSLGYHAYPYFQTYFHVGPEFPVGNFTPDDVWKEKFDALYDRFEICAENQLFYLLPLFFELLADCVNSLDSGGRLSEMVEAASLYLGSNHQQKKDLRKFCTEHGWGYENFRKLFRKAVGLSPGQYRTRCRMDAAKGFLMADDRSLQEIAKELGFCSVFEFSEQFRRYTGIAPGAFRSGKIL